MDKDLKKVLIDILVSHSKLASAEYNRTPSFNNEHWAYKAEENMINYLDKNDPKVRDELFIEMRNNS